MDLQLEGKRALVTGASRGIGKAIALALANEGVDVAIVARQASPLQETASWLREATGRRIVPITGDSGDNAAVRAVVDQAVRDFGGLDILVNNAATPGGAAPAASIAEVDGQALLDDVNVKVAGYLRFAKAAAPHLVASGWGRIINIGGLAARSTGHYVASVRNAAVSALTKNLADELGPSGVTAIAIHPGATRTERTTAEQEERLAAGNSIRRLVDSADIAWLVTVLASPRNVAINGETIGAGGGVPKVITF